MRLEAFPAEAELRGEESQALELKLSFSCRDRPQMRAWSRTKHLQLRGSVWLSKSIAMDDLNLLLSRIFQIHTVTMYL